MGDSELILLKADNKKAKLTELATITVGISQQHLEGQGQVEEFLLKLL